MKIFYAQEIIPDKKPTRGYSVFLAGPTPRTHSIAKSWRPEMVSLLSTLDESEISEVFIPEPRNGFFTSNYLDQVNWEEEAIKYCDILVFWVERNIEKGMPGFTTNVEFGWWLDKKEKIILGYPPGADSCRYLGWKFKKYRPKQEIAVTMQEVLLQIKDYCKK